MIIGIDFDNTIANYETAFYNAARDLNWIPENVERSKVAVKSYFIERDEERLWTELQGIVYGKSIHLASPFDGVKKTLQKWIERGTSLYIISHKTTYPVIGERTNLHNCAMQWLHDNGLVGKQEIPVENVFFNEEKAQKVQRIGELNCDVFVDDLPSIFQHVDFPENVRKLYFNPNLIKGSKAADFADFCASNWYQISQIIDDQQ